MKDLNTIQKSIKKYYIEASMSSTGNEEVKKAIQSIGIVLLFFENSLDEKFVIRDSRNLVYDLLKPIKHKESKKLLKGLLKIIK